MHFVLLSKGREEGQRVEEDEEEEGGRKRERSTHLHLNTLPKEANYGHSFTHASYLKKGDSIDGAGGIIQPSRIILFDPLFNPITS